MRQFWARKVQTAGRRSIPSSNLIGLEERSISASLSKIASGGIADRRLRGSASLVRLVHLASSSVGKMVRPKHSRETELYLT